MQRLPELTDDWSYDSVMLSFTDVLSGGQTLLKETLEAGSNLLMEVRLA